MIKLVALLKKKSSTVLLFFIIMIGKSIKEGSMNVTIITIIVRDVSSATKHLVRVLITLHFLILT